MEILEQLRICGFTEAGRIAMAGDYPAPTIDKACCWNGGVYAWVAHREEGAEILYVGKAGRTLRQRCREHQAGFNGTAGSRAGLRNGAYLAEALRTGARISIWGRASAHIELFGQTVSLCSTEEEALIARFNPVLNRSAKPKVRLERPPMGCD